MQPEKMEIIEMNVGGTHKLSATKSVLTRYQNSLLTAFFSSGNNLTKMDGKVYIDRDGEPFSLLISFLRSGKSPIFQSENQETAFRNELNYWQIPFGPSYMDKQCGDPMQFDPQFCASTLNLEPGNRIVKKIGLNHGIVFANKPMDSSETFIEFRVLIQMRYRGKSNLFVGLVDKSCYTPSSLSKN
jgi:hypothetical protein